MAGFSDLLRDSIAVADSVTSSLQAKVIHAAFKNYNRSGEPQHEDGVDRTAIVEQKQQLKRATDGTEKMSHTKLTLVGPVAVDPKDKITLPDGSSPLILAVSSPLDDTGNPLITEVWF